MKLSSIKIFVNVIFIAMLISCGGQEVSTKTLAIGEQEKPETNGGSTDQGSDDTNENENGDNDGDGDTDNGGEPSVTEQIEPDTITITQSYYVEAGETLETFLYNNKIQNITDIEVVESPSEGVDFNIDTGRIQYTHNGSQQPLKFTANVEGKKHEFIIDFISSSNLVVDGYPTVEKNNELYSGFSVEAGETINLHLNASSESDGIIYITDIANKIIKKIDVSYKPQSPINEEPWKNGFGYESTISFIIDSDFNSGVYFVNGIKDVFFVVKDESKEKAITLVLPTNTMMSYSCHGGKGLYGCNGVPADTHVSFLRPIRPTSEYSWTWDIIALTVPTLKWLELESEFAGKIQYVIDSDLDNTSEFFQSELLLVPAHNEYWTMKARHNFDQFVLNGKDSLILGGNIMWWHIRYEDDGRKLAMHRSFDDPDAQPGEETAYFHEMAYGAHKSIGGLFQYGGYNANKWDIKSSPNSMRVVRPNSPIFEGTGLELCSELDLSNNHEMDGPPISGFDENGLPHVAYQTMSGVHNYEILAYTWGYRGGHTIGTTHAFQKSESSGTVLQFASNGAAAFAFTNSTESEFKTTITNSVNIFLNGRYQFESDTLYQAKRAIKMKFPYKGERIEGIEICPR